MSIRQMRHTAQINKMGDSIKKMMNLQETMQKIRNGEELYTVMSLCTRMPFVYCSPKTYDDEVFIYFDKDGANMGARWILEEKNPIQLARIDKNSRLGFFTSLFPMGVNAVSVDQGLTYETGFQLDQLVRRQDTEQMPEGKLRIENPELHLTSLYFAQEFRKNMDAKTELPEGLRELNEEMLVHFCKGKYVIAIEEGKGFPLLQKNKEAYQPVFTDIPEFQKFNREKKYGMAVVEYEKIRKILGPETKGVVLNPFGVDIMLKI